jgi:hypothetical protein
MTIAILGWGSLIWQPKELAFNAAIGWQKEGPMLPIEFARISKDGRLTLVISKNGTEVKTLYAISNYETTEEAVLNLAVRESSGRPSIGYFEKATESVSPPNFQFKQNIKEWIDQTDFDAVIWTNLGENWTEKTNDRINYLKELKEPTRAIAEEYIRRTPIQILTTLRKSIEQELNWKPIL